MTCLRMGAKTNYETMCKRNIYVLFKVFRHWNRKWFIFFSFLMQRNWSWHLEAKYTWTKWKTIDEFKYIKKYIFGCLKFCLSIFHIEYFVQYWLVNHDQKQWRQRRIKNKKNFIFVVFLGYLHILSFIWQRRMKNKRRKWTLETLCAFFHSSLVATWNQCVFDNLGIILTKNGNVLQMHKNNTIYHNCCLCLCFSCVENP